jgi:hypothetical protein
MDKEIITTILAIVFFLVCVAGFFSVYYFNSTAVATFDIDDELAQEIGEEKTDDIQAGAAVTEIAADGNMLLLQIMIAVSLLAIGGFAIRARKPAPTYSNAQLSKYFLIGMSKGYSVDSLKEELIKQDIPEQQINKVLKDMGKL